MLGMVKSSRGVRIAPRSSPTTCSPAFVSSRDKMLPVQPIPMTTASVSFSTVTIARSSGKVRYRKRALVIFLVEIGLDLVAIARGKSWKADHLPRHLVFVSAINRIGEEPFHGELKQAVEEEGGCESGIEFG